MGRGIVIVLVLLAAGIGMFYWMSSRPIEVTVIAPNRGTAADVVYATAVVEPVHWAKVTSLVRKRIISMCGCEGQIVKEGDELAVLDSDDARANLKELEARQELAQSERERAYELLQRRVVSQTVYDKAQTELVKIDALIAAQTERLGDYRIRAPIDGMVLRKDGSVGEVAEPGEILFWIGQPVPLQLVAEVNEEDIPKVEPGQITYVDSDAFPDQVLEAVVERITPKGDPVLKTYRVYLSLPADTPLLIGMTTEINIVTRQVNDALLVPAAVLDGDTLMIAGDDGIAEKRTLETGIRGTRAVQILGGLPEDAQIIAPYPEDITAGDKVEARTGDGS